MEIIKEEISRHRSKKKGINNALKFSITFITSLLILFAIGMISRLLVLERYFKALNEAGFYELTTLSLLIYIGSLVVLNIFIYELNDKLNNHSVTVGLLLATIFSLPELINSVHYSIPFQIIFVVIVSNYISLILASYVFVKILE